MLNQYTEEGYLDYSSKKMTGNMVANARYSTVIPGKRFSGCSLNTHEVWSLTQFYSVDFSHSMIGLKSAFSTNAQSRFASAVVDGVLGPPRLVSATPDCDLVSL